MHWRRKRGGQGGMCPPTHFREWGGGAKICLCPPPPPHFQTQNLGIEPTDICDVTLAWLASRCWARQMCPPPPTFCHVPTPLLCDEQGRSLRGGKGGNCPPWDFQFLWFFKLIIPKSNTEIATWYLLRRHCPPRVFGPGYGPDEWPE